MRFYEINRLTKQRNRNENKATGDKILDLPFSVSPQLKRWLIIDEKYN